MTEVDRNLPIVPVEGWSALKLTFRGVVLELCAAACVLPLALESVLPGRWYYWAIPIGVVFIALMSVGATWTFKSFAKSKREIQRGYTTLWNVAVQRPELSYLSAYDFGLVSGPGEPRPRRGTRKVIDEFRAQRET